MNKKLILGLCSVIACNAYAERPALETPKEVLQSMQDVTGITQAQTGAYSESNSYSGIIDALLKAHKTCKPSEERLKKNLLELADQAQGHLVDILTEAFKSMDSDQRRICGDIFSNLYKFAVDVKSTLNLAKEPGRSEQEQQILWEDLVERSRAQLFVLAMVASPLNEAAAKHAGLSKKLENNDEIIKNSAENILARVISVLDTAKQMVSENHES